MSVSLQLSDREITTSLPAMIIGILNVTPDSFYQKSRVVTIDESVRAALTMIDDGADIIDIGGESTRPGSKYVSEEEELTRIIPVVEEIRKHTSIPISIDTRKSAVLRKALAVGADILNDISALQDDPSMITLVAEKKIPVILMHKKGIPKTMQNTPYYDNVVSEVCLFLQQRIEFAIRSGVAAEKIIIDPGIGFGKSFEDNCQLIRNLSKLKDCGVSVMMALSRKSCIGKMTDTEIPERLIGSVVANMISVQNGATFLRVHDVSETRDMLRVLQEIG